MRAIKFRAWHAKSNYMFSAETMAKDQLTLLPTGQFINVHGSDTRMSLIFSLETMAPMQYTGIQDKNGVEIYEGDIVQYKIGTTFLVGDVIWDEKTAQFAKRGELVQGTWTFKPLSSYLATTEVIGNVWENPELLEASDGK